VNNEGVAFKTNKMLIDLQSFHGDLVLLDLNNLVDGCSNVKLVNGLGEILLLFIQNGVVKHIMHEVIDELRSRNNLLCAGFKSLMDILQHESYLGNFRIAHSKFLRVDNHVFETFQEGLKLVPLPNQGS